MADKTVVLYASDGTAVPVLYRDNGDGTYSMASGLAGPSGAAVVLADDAAFTPATSSVIPMGAFADETAPDSVTEGDIGAPRMTLNRVLRFVPTLHDGTNDANVSARAAPSAGGSIGATGLQAVGLGLWSSSGVYYPWYAGNAIGDGNGSQSAAVAVTKFNNATWDKDRNNTEGTLLASAARTATTNSADQVNYNARGVRVSLNISVAPGGDTITAAIEEKDPITGAYTAILTGAAQSTTGQKPVLVVYPGQTVAANVSASSPLPRTWRVSVTHSAGTSFTYSVAYALVL